MTDYHVLVMNKSWTPIAVTTIRRGLSLVFREQARIVDSDTFDMHTWEEWLEAHSVPIERGSPRTPGFIHTVSLRIRMPRVVVLAEYGGVPERQVAYSRRALLRRDNFQCQYCGAMPGLRALTIDHVFPRSRGGRNDWGNCVIACVKCNVRKGNRTPEEAGMPLMRAATKPSWAEGLLGGKGAYPPEWARFVPAS